MRAKKTSKPSSRPVRYLLSADRRLQKISLRKLSDRFKGTSPRSSAAPAKAATAARPPGPPIPPPPKAYSWRAIVVGMTCVLAAAALMTARQPAEEGDAAGVAGPQRASISTASVAASKPAPAVASRPASAAPSKPPLTAASKPAANVVSQPAPKPASTDRLAATVTPGSDVESASPVMTVAATDKPAAAAVTITGCLERDDDSFWLKDTSGDVAKSRSWKTGFLRKRSPKIALVGGPGASTLSALVGERVAAQGTLVDRELRARSVWRIGPACD